MAKRAPNTPNTRSYRAPDRMPEREAQWKTLDKAMSSPPAKPVNVSGRRRNPR